MPKFTIKSDELSYDLKHFSQPNQIICYANILIWFKFSWGILGDISKETLMQKDKVMKDQPQSEKMFLCRGSP